MQNMKKTACERLHNMSQPERAENVIDNLSKTVLLGDWSKTYSKWHVSRFAIVPWRNVV